LERRVLSTDQVANAVRLERDELNKRLATLLKEQELDQQTWSEERKRLQKKIDELAAEITVLKSTPSSAGRVALVIGINSYPNLPWARLTRAENDARAMADTLKSLGFDVIRAEKTDGKSIDLYLNEFYNRIRRDDMAFVFFSGHGVAIKGYNYLLPSDVQFPTTEEQQKGAEAKIRNQGLEENAIIRSIQDKKPRVAVIVIDACRNNPFRGPDAARSGIGLERGLQVIRDEYPEGVFQIYSANLNETALDSLGPDDRNENSIFTRSFLPKLSLKNTHLGDILPDVRQEVMNLARKVTDQWTGAPHSQRPEYHDAAMGRVCLSPDDPCVRRQ